MDGVLLSSDGDTDDPTEDAAPTGARARPNTSEVTRPGYEAQAGFDAAASADT